MQTIERITITRKEAAEAYGVSLPLFDQLTRRKVDPLPIIRAGMERNGAKRRGRVLVPVEPFRAWVARQVDNAPSR